jgi:transcriptional regulator with XRE-family HTH domain
MKILADRILGDRVRTLRAQHGWNQEELAVRAGLVARTVRRIEQGEDAYIGTVEAIADALGVSLADLVVDAA